MTPNVAIRSAYAGHHVELVDEYALWATVAFTIFASTNVDGLAVGIAVERATGEAQSGKTACAEG